jgi:flavin-dependent dehydrogenase
VVERTGYEASRIGETLAPGLRGVLEYLGAWDSFAADCHRPSFGTSALWGTDNLATRDFIMTPFGAGWHLDRRRFDASLAREAEATGVVLLRHARATVMRQETGGWRLCVNQYAGPRVLEAPILVDATGTAALVARHAGAQRHVLDRMVALTATLDLAAAQTDEMLTLVETFAGGWWYSARLPGPHMVVALMTDRDFMEENGWSDATRWWQLLRQQRHSWQRLAAALRTKPLQLFPAFFTCASPAAGDDWVAVGDAASSQDPLSASGIARALNTGIHAARAIDMRLRSGSAAALMAYAKWIASSFAAYWTTRMAYYDLERRWPNAPFWQRRHPVLTLDPHCWIERAPHAGLADADGVRKERLVDRALLGRLCAAPCTAHQLVARYQAHAEIPAPDIEIILTLQSLIEERVLTARQA